MTGLAITGALDLNAQPGGGQVESSPHDVANQSISSFLYIGTDTSWDGATPARPREKGLFRRHGCRR